MDRTTVEYYRLRLYLLMLAAVSVGLVFSPPVLSVGLFGICFLGVLDPLVGINPNWRTNVGAFFWTPLPWALISLYLLLLFGAWQTYDWTYYLERLRIKTPLLLVPFAWAGLPKLNRSQQGKVVGAFALSMAVVLAGVLINYVFDYTAINQAIREGRAMPVPRNHIRFSLLVALGIFSALRAGELKAWKRTRSWYVVAGFLFLAAHVLAVRSGLAGAYAGVGAYVLVAAWARGRWWPAVVALTGLALLPVIAYLAVPSLRTKLDYARYELFQRERSAEDAAEYSDEGRLVSIRLGLQVWQDNRLLGVGPGNLRAEMDQRYAAAYPALEGKRPHNQFVSALAGSGILGGVVTIGAFLVLALVGLRRRDAVFMGVWTLFFISCLVENTLENTAGVCMFTVFLLVFGARPLGEELQVRPCNAGEGEDL